jgi:hypothetical protein
MGFDMLIFVFNLPCSFLCANMGPMGLWAWAPERAGGGGRAGKAGRAGRAGRAGPGQGGAGGPAGEVGLGRAGKAWWRNPVPRAG